MFGQPTTVEKNQLIHKSIKHFRVPKEIIEYDYIDSIFYDLKTNEKNTFDKIFTLFQKNNHMLDNLIQCQIAIDGFSVYDTRMRNFQNYLLEKGYFFNFPSSLSSLAIYYNDILSSIAIDDIDKFKEEFEKINDDKYEDSGFKLIDFACAFGAIKCFKHMRLNNVPTTRNSFKYSIVSGCQEIMMQILNEDAIDTTAQEYSNCFHIAVLAHHYDIADYFLENAADDASIVLNFSKYSQYRNYRAICFFCANKLTMSADYFEAHLSKLFPYFLRTMTKANRDYIYSDLGVTNNFLLMKAFAYYGFNMNKPVRTSYFREIYPLNIAVNNGDPELYQYLIDHGADEKIARTTKSQTTSPMTFICLPISIFIMGITFTTLVLLVMMGYDFLEIL